MSAVMVRLMAASSTLEIQGKDIIGRAVSLGSSPALNNVDLNKLVFTFKPNGTKSITVSGTYNGQPVTSLNVVNENNIWKIDYVSIFSARNVEIEKEITAEIQKTGKTREEVLQLILEVFFIRSNSQLNYLVWVPLNQRGDLNADNAKFQSHSDPTNGWSILFPEHWEIDYVGSTIFFLAPYSTDGIRSTIAITPNQSPTSLNLETYIDYVITELVKIKTDISGPVEKTSIQFQNQPAYKITYKRLRTFNGGRTYITQPNESLVFFRNNIAYMVEYRNGLAEFNAGKTLSDKIINTLKFGPVCTMNCMMGY